MVSTQLDSAFTNLHPFLDYLSKERREFTRDIGRERAAILGGIAEERLAVLEALANERSQVLEAIALERNITLEEISKLTLATVTQVVETSQSIADNSIDRAYRRTLQLMALPFAVSVILSVAALLLLRSALRRNRHEGRPPAQQVES
jgi:DNA-binding ferritin-like protein